MSRTIAKGKSPRRILSMILTLAMVFALLPVGGMAVYADSTTHTVDDCTTWAYAEGVWVGGCSEGIAVGDTLEIGMIFNDLEGGETSYLDGNQMSPSEGSEFDLLVVKIDGDKIYLCSNHSPSTGTTHSGYCDTCGRNSEGAEYSRSTTLVTITNFTMPTSLDMNEDLNILYPNFEVSGEGTIYDLHALWCYEDPDGYDIGTGTKYGYDVGKPVAGRTYVYLFEIFASGVTNLELKIGNDVYTATPGQDAYTYYVVFPIGTVDEEGNIAGNSSSPTDDASGDDGSGALLLIAAGTATGIAVYNAPAIMAKAEQYGIGKALAAKLVKAHDFFFVAPADRDEEDTADKAE